MLTADEAIYQYCEAQSTAPSPLCEELADFTRAKVEHPIMLSGPIVASFLGFLIRNLRAKRILEFGTFTGYSALAMAENLPLDGELITLDINPESQRIAKSYWEKSPHGHKIRPICAPAVEALKTIKGPFDFIFIDADKPGYVEYLKSALEMLSPYGIIVADNCLYGGMVTQKNPAEANAQAIQRFNQTVKANPNLKICLLPVRDGLYLIQKL